MNFSKGHSIIFSMAVILIVLSPVLQNWAKKPSDSFPLSYYPMFSKKRGDTYGLYYLIAHDTLGNSKRLPYHHIGTGGFNQVRRQINKAHKNSGGIPFLKKVVKRISRKDRSLYDKLAKLELVKGYYHLERYFLDQDTLPLLERKIATYQITGQ